MNWQEDTSSWDIGVEVINPVDIAVVLSSSRKVAIQLDAQEAALLSPYAANEFDHPKHVTRNINHIPDCELVRIHPARRGGRSLSDERVQGRFAMHICACSVQQTRRRRRI